MTEAFCGGGRDVIFTLNAGSSSIKFAVYECPDPTSEKQPGDPAEIARGQVKGLGGNAELVLDHEKYQKREKLGDADQAECVDAILTHTSALLGSRSVVGVSHRIAHGGVEFDSPRVLDPQTMAHLRRLEPLAPLHQPFNLAAVDASRTVFPDALQVGCFDTAFHRTHPWVNDTFALPRKFYDQGVRRYGFHGLSFEYLTGVLKEADPDLAGGSVVIAHLGNGASMCAIQGGRSIASTMGFSALDGLAMGTRCGQLDPGVLLYLMDSERMTSSQISDLLYLESGLKGLSGMTNDMRELEASEAPEAAEAIDYYVSRIRRELGAMCAVLGGIDAFVFSGGVGENSRMVRRKVCEGMDWLGISVDLESNEENAREISSGNVRVLVIPTNEEIVLARALAAALAGK